MNKQLIYYKSFPENKKHNKRSDLKFNDLFFYARNCIHLKALIFKHEKFKTSGDGIHPHHRIC